MFLEKTWKLENLTIRISDISYDEVEDLPALPETCTSKVNYFATIRLIYTAILR